MDSGVSYKCQGSKDDAFGRRKGGSDGERVYERGKGGKKEWGERAE